MVSMGSRWLHTCKSNARRVSALSYGVKKIQIQKKITRDVKGLSSRCLVLGQVESVFGHPSCCSSRTNYLSRKGVVSGPVRAQGGCCQDLSGSKGAAARSAGQTIRRLVEIM
jgi:hypothetical protein